jgi:hypothetical protein
VLFHLQRRTELNLFGNEIVEVEGKELIVSKGEVQAAEVRDNRMKTIIPEFAKVQDALKAVGYKVNTSVVVSSNTFQEAENFPQIVVVGVQSSGIKYRLPFV